MRTFTGAIFASFEWFMRIVKLNLIWLLSSIVGLLLFSLFPATVASFAVTNQWVNGHVDVPIWKTFWRALKKYYWRAQLLGYLMVMALLILYIDFRFFINVDHLLIKTMALILLFVVAFFVMIIVLHILPITVELNLSMVESIKNAFYTGLAFIHWSIVSFLGIVGILLATYRYPATFFFLTAGSLFLWIHCLTSMIRHKIETKYFKLRNEGYH